MRFTVFLFLLVISQVTFSQSHPLGLNPSNLKWYEIDNDYVKVIFPEGSKGKAQRVANVVYQLNMDSSYSLGSSTEKVSMVLHNQTLLSNGFVGFGPFRSELYQNGPLKGFAGTADWIDLLTIHEYRHVQQFANARQGITKLSSWLFGQNGWAGASVLALPPWFFEGDAVFFETAMTFSGRGRMPNIENEYRAYLNSEKRLSYEKASAGSFKKFVPNHYSLGYFMTTGARKKYGADIWESTLTEAVRYKRIFYPLSRSLKSSIGKTTPKLYKETMEDLKMEWETIPESSDVSVKINQTKKRTFTNYRNPKFLNSGTILTEKQGYSNIPSYYKIDVVTGEESKITNPGIYSEDNATLSVFKNTIYWAETAFDERWGNQDYSSIVAYNLNKKQKQILTFKSKYYAPNINSVGTTIVAINIEIDGKHNLHLIDVNGRKAIVSEILPNPENLEFAFPQWKGESSIVVIGKKAHRNALFEYDLVLERWSRLTPWWTDQISYPVLNGNDVYFHGTFDRIDNIYAWKGGKLYRITNSEFGAVQPEVSSDGKDLIFSDYSAQGYNLKIISLAESSWDEVDFGQLESPSYFGSTVLDSDFLGTIPTRTTEIKSFKEFTGLKLHSWIPQVLPQSFLEPVNELPTVGMWAEVDNTLKTISARGLYLFNLNEGTSSLNLDIDYGKYYPVFNVSISSARRNRYVAIYSERNVNGQRQGSLDYPVNTWKENKIGTSVTLPWNLTSGSFYSFLWTTMGYDFIDVSYDNADLGTDGSFGAGDLEINFGVRQRRAKQYVNPRFGFGSNVVFRRTVGAVFNESQYFQISGTGYLPGIMRNHSFFLTAHYKSEPIEASYKFSDQFFYARGHSGFIHDNVVKYGVNYKLPLLYPDLGLGPFVFLQRVVLNGFYDFMTFSIDAHPVSDYRATSGVRFEGRSNSFSTNASSAGAEVTFNFRFMRLADMNLGFRYSRLLDGISIPNKNQFELIIISLGLN